MADRLIRDELWHSARWLDLPTDTHRLVYISLIMRADDYGNLEGGPRRLFRWMHTFTQVKTEEDSIKLMSELQDADLVRRYEVIHKEYWHLPRFQNKRWYWSRQCPKSPYAEEEIPKNQRSRKKTRKKRTSTRRGVGVGVGVKYKTFGLSISPTRGGKVENNVKTVFKKMPLGQEQNQEQIERNRRIGIALANGNVKLAKAIKAGRA